MKHIKTYSKTSTPKSDTISTFDAHIWLYWVALTLQNRVLGITGMIQWNRLREHNFPVEMIIFCFIATLRKSL